MPILHMDTNLVEDEARLLLRASTDMRDTINSLHYAIRSLSSNWQGGDAEHYIDEVENVIKRIIHHVDGLDALSQRTHREVQQWVDTDGRNSIFSDMWSEISISKDDALKVFSGTYLATHLRGSLLRPNSMIFTGPNWMRKILGIKEMTRVIKPSTLGERLAVVAYAEDLKNGVETGILTFRDLIARDSIRALPAGILDGLLKTAILAGGTLLLTSATSLILGISGPPVIIGGAVILTWVAGSFLMEKFVEPFIWNNWQNSYTRNLAIEELTRIKNSMQQTFKNEINKINSIFRPYMSKLLSAPP